VQRLSAVIITLNEERNIERCLASLRGVADEIVVVDSHSTDATAAICAAHGVRFIVANWQGYVQTKNWANQQAAHDWVLSVDADEALDDALRTNILHEKQRGFPYGAYAVRRSPWWCGAWIRHSGWNPDRKVRLFNRTTARWAGGQVHETLQLDAGIQPTELAGRMPHYTMHTVQDHLRVIDKYTELQVHDMRARGKRGSLLKVLVNPPWEFFKCYVIKGGFRDGRAGLLVCSLNAYTKFVKYAKLLVSEQ
jgi:glycosyltransferase involved in cell wall biosynthesis